MDNQLLGFTDNDKTFFTALQYCHAEGVFMFFSKQRKYGFRAIRQIDPEGLPEQLAYIRDKKSEKTGNPTYWNQNTDLYMTNNTLFPSRDLHKGGLRDVKRVSQLVSLCFDIDCHADGAPEHLSDYICEKLTNAMVCEDIPIGFIVNTGRGAAIWVLLDCPANPNDKYIMYLYNEIHNAYRNRLKEIIKSLGEEFSCVCVDDTVQGINHVMRVPGSYNVTAGRVCRVAFAPIESYWYYDIQVLARELDVALNVVPDPSILGYEHNMRFPNDKDERLEWARKRWPMRNATWTIIRSLERGRARERTDAEIAQGRYRFTRTLAFLSEHATPVGKRHNALLGALSTCYDWHGKADINDAHLINATFAEPLPEHEVERILRWVSKPCKTSNLAEWLGISHTELNNIFKQHDNFEYDKKKERYYGISKPIASSLEDRVMLQTLIQAKEIPDYRISGHKWRWEAQQNRMKREAVYNKIIPMFNEGKSISDIAKALDITRPTVYAQAKKRGLDIVEAEKERKEKSALEIQSLYAQGYSADDIARMVGCHRATVFRKLKVKVEATAEKLKEAEKDAAKRVSELVEDLTKKAKRESLDVLSDKDAPKMKKAECRLDVEWKRRKVQELLSPQAAGRVTKLIMKKLRKATSTLFSAVEKFIPPATPQMLPAPIGVDPKDAAQYQHQNYSLKDALLEDRSPYDGWLWKRPEWASYFEADPRD